MNFTGFVTSKNVMDSTLLRKMLKYIIDIRPKEIKKKKRREIHMSCKPGTCVLISTEFVYLGGLGGGTQ